MGTNLFRKTFRLKYTELSDNFYLVFYSYKSDLNHSSSFPWKQIRENKVKKLTK